MTYAGELLGWGYRAPRSGVVKSSVAIDGVPSPRGIADADVAQEPRAGACRPSRLLQLSPIGPASLAVTFT